VALQAFLITLPSKDLIYPNKLKNWEFADAEHILRREKPILQLVWVYLGENLLNTV
jgi:hypothetical protein